MESSIQKIIKELRDAGYTQTSLATAAGCSQATISDLESGAQDDTKFSYGLRLQKLHADLKNKSGAARRSKRAMRKAA